MKQLFHNKSFFFLFIIFAVGIFVRWCRLSEFMPFIGDQGWFYLSAQDMILRHTIPLVGITSSHTWLHQGPYWTYILAGIFTLTKFNPLVPGYVTTFLDGLTIIVLYATGKKFFSEKAGIVASTLYAFSPLVIITSRMPYHTALISLCTALFIFSLLQWMRNGAKYFPFIIAMLAVLYNFELATTVFWFLLVVMLLFGIGKKESYVTHILSRQTLIISLLSFITLMFPILIYDMSHGMKQTVVFAGWTIYQIISAPTHLLHHQNTHVNFFAYLQTFIERLLFLPSSIVALLLFTLILAVFVYAFSRVTNTYKVVYCVVGLSFIVPFLSVIAGGVPSDAYLPMLFPGFMLIAGTGLTYVIKRVSLLLLIVAIFAAVNTWSLVSQHYLIGVTGGYGPAYAKRVSAMKQILSDTHDSSYTIRGAGPGSQFASFTMNYTYLGWYFGHAPVNHGKELFSIYETPNQVLVTK